jgi:hypothetical protein
LVVISDGDYRIGSIVLRNTSNICPLLALCKWHILCLHNAQMATKPND